jgi:hypothetical protein
MIAQHQPDIPRSYAVGQEINWGAPWIDVNLWVELPFWLIVEKTIQFLQIPGERVFQPPRLLSTVI